MFVWVCLIESIYLMVPFKGVRHHSFHFSEKPHLMVNEALFSIDCSSVGDLTVPCLSSKAVVNCSKDHWTFSETAEASTNQQVALILSCLLLFYTLIAVQENQITLEQSQAECRETLHKLLPNVPLPNEQVCSLRVSWAFCVVSIFKIRLTFVLLFTSLLH